MRFAAPETAAGSLPQGESDAGAVGAAILTARGRMREEAHKP